MSVDADKAAYVNSDTGAGSMVPVNVPYIYIWWLHTRQSVACTSASHPAQHRPSHRKV